jgi:hypothetical protein
MPSGLTDWQQRNFDNSQLPDDGRAGCGLRTFFVLSLVQPLSATALATIVSNVRTAFALPVP